MFDEMVSEKLIEWIWILASAGIVIFGLLMMLAGGGFLGFLMALVYITFGLLITRVVCEAMLIGFKMFATNKRSLAVLEQMSREQAVTRQVIQVFLERTAPAMAPAAAATPAPQMRPVSPPAARATVPATPVSVTSNHVSADSSTPHPLLKDDYHDRMMEIRDRLEQEAREKRRY